MSDLLTLRITRVDATLPMPAYQTKGAVAFDVYARERTVVPAGGIALVPSNLIVQVPDGYMLMLCSRSSTPIKKGLATPHGFGIVDQDFCGPDDEMRVQLHNITKKDVVVERGDRIAQAVLSPIERCEIVECVLETAESRGGFGSTG